VAIHHTADYLKRSITGKHTPRVNDARPDRFMVLHNRLLGCNISSKVYHDNHHGCINFKTNPNSKLKINLTPLSHLWTNTGYGFKIKQNKTAVLSPISFTRIWMI
jgi:hypothetical protein